MLPQVLIQPFVTYESCSILKADSFFMNSLRVSIENAFRLIPANADLALRIFNYIMVKPTVFNANIVIQTSSDQ